MTSDVGKLGTGPTYPPSPPDRRLFFAFWPDEALRAALEAARQRVFPLAGRPVAAAGLHVTAAFLGRVPESRLPALLELAAPVPPLTIRLDRLEHWPKPKVLVAAAGELRPDLRTVVANLWRRLDRLGFARETRPYRPHVTLARDVRHLRPGIPWPAFDWPAERLVLVESVATATGTSYRPVASPASPH